MQIITINDKTITSTQVKAYALAAWDITKTILAYLVIAGEAVYLAGGYWRYAVHHPKQELKRRTKELMVLAHRSVDRKSSFDEAIEQLDRRVDKVIALEVAINETQKANRKTRKTRKVAAK